MSATHFQGKYEVELKYRLSDKKKFLETLKAQPHEVMYEDNIESDWFFDTPEKSLGEQKISLCIRSVQPADSKLWIVKGPEPDQCQVTQIKSTDTAKSMLESMGYSSYQFMKKQRSIYFMGPYHITVDYIEGVGLFSEFGIMTDNVSLLVSYRKQLERLARFFDLGPEELVHNSYRNMC